MAPSARTSLNPLNRHLGLIYAFTSCLSFVLMDLAAQYLLIIDPINALSIMFLRMIPSAVFAYAYLWWVGEGDLPFGAKGMRGILFLRSVNVWVGLQTFFYAVRHISISDAMVIYQARPFVLGYFSKLFLNEPMNGIQKIAAGISIFGEIFIAKPALLFSSPKAQEVITSGPGSITHSSRGDHFISWALIVLTVFNLVFDLIILRKIRGIHPFLLLGLLSLTSIVLSGGTLVITRLPLVFPSSILAWGLLIFVQITGVFSQVLLAASLKLETAVTMSLVSQFQVVPAAVLELIAFGKNQFDVLTPVGMVLTTSAGAWAIMNRPAQTETDSEVAEEVEMPLLDGEWTGQDRRAELDGPLPPGKEVA